jgi:hypothetical protein
MSLARKLGMKCWLGAAYVVNLKERNDRLVELRAEFDRHGIQYVTIDVPPNHELSDELFECADPRAVRILRFNRHAKGGMVGCATSHSAIWRYEAEKDVDDDGQKHPVFIMEDDVVLTAEFTPRLLEEIQHRLKTEADIVTCGITLWAPDTHAFAAPGKPPILIHTRYVRGAHAYALTRQGDLLRRLCTMYSKPGVMGNMHADVALEIVSNLPEFNALVTLPYVASQRVSPSDNTWDPELPLLNKLTEMPMFLNIQSISLLPILNHAARKTRHVWYKAAGGKAPEDERNRMWWWLARQPAIIVTIALILMVALVLFAMRVRRTCNLQSLHTIPTTAALQL